MQIVLGGRAFHSRLPLRNGESGQAAIELLLILPTFLLWMLLIVDFGVLMYEYVTVASAVREGARWGSVNCNPALAGGSAGTCTVNTSTGLRQWTINKSNGILSAADTFTIGWNDRDGLTPGNLVPQPGDSVVVKVAHNYSLVVQPPGKTILIPVKACADMRLEGTENGAGSSYTWSVSC